MAPTKAGEEPELEETEELELEQTEELAAAGAELELESESGEELAAIGAASTEAETPTPREGDVESSEGERF